MGKSSFTLTTLPFFTNEALLLPSFRKLNASCLRPSGETLVHRGDWNLRQRGGVSIRVEREVCRGKQSREAQGLCTAPQADAFGSGVGARREAQDLRTAPQAGVPDAEGSAAGRRKAEESNPGGAGSSETPNSISRRIPRCAGFRFGAIAVAKRRKSCGKEPGRAADERKIGVERPASRKPGSSRWRAVSRIANGGEPGASN